MSPARVPVRGSAANDWEMMGDEGNDYTHEAGKVLCVVKSCNVLLQGQSSWNGCVSVGG